jgi:hypothetical protein
MMHSMLLGLFTAMLLGACGQSATDQAPVKLFEPQRHALDKARAVEQQQQERNQQMQRQIEEQN